MTEEQVKRQNANRKSKIPGTTLLDRCRPCCGFAFCVLPFDLFFAFGGGRRVALCIGTFHRDSKLPMCMHIAYVN
jgi:hypothetical protein